MKLRLRIATPDDAPFVRETYAYYIQNTVATFHEHLKTEQEYRESIGALLQTHPYLVAEDEAGTFLGFCCAEPMRPQSGYRFTVELTIYLHPSAPHGEGIGKRLYGALLPMLRAQGFCNAYGVLESTNEPSLALHRSFGFTEDARMESVAYKHGQWLSAVWMRKVLGEPTDEPREIIPFAEYRHFISQEEQPK